MNDIQFVCFTDPPTAQNPKSLSPFTKGSTSKIQNFTQQMSAFGLGRWDHPKSQDETKTMCAAPPSFVVRHVLVVSGGIIGGEGLRSNFPPQISNQCFLLCLADEHLCLFGLCIYISMQKIPFLKITPQISWPFSEDHFL